MTRSGDRFTIAVDGNTVTIQIYATVEDSDDLPDAVVTALFGQDPQTGQLDVRRVSLHTPGEPLAARSLQRFAWARWLAVADAAIRVNSGTAAQRFDANERLRHAADRALEIDGVRNRPGPKPKPDDFYREIADRYLELRAVGDHHPTATIAAERDQSRDTVAGWVLKARRRGFLPPARPGRSG